MTLRDFQEGLRLKGVYRGISSPTNDPRECGLNFGRTYPVLEENRWSKEPGWSRSEIGYYESQVEYAAIDKGLWQ